ncbi:NaeI family type II restriction endonuclease [Corynebacterium striatum]
MVPTNRKQAVPRSRNRGTNYPRSADYLKHQKIASELGLPIPKDGDSLSTRLVKCEKSFEGSKTYIDDSYWRIATPTDEVEPAPTLPFK